MPSIHELAGLTLGVAWAVGMVSALLWFAETIAVLLFLPWTYRHGFVIYSEMRNMPQPNERLPLNTTFKTDGGAFRFVAPDECLFRGKVLWFAMRPLPAPGVIRWSGDQAKICCRLPISLTLFFAALLIGWLAALAPIVLEHEHAGLILLGLLAALFVVVGGFAGGIGLGLDRTKAVVGELEVVLQKPTASDPSSESGTRSGI